MIALARGFVADSLEVNALNGRFVVEAMSTLTRRFAAPSSRKRERGTEVSPTVRALLPLAGEEPTLSDSDVERGETEEESKGGPKGRMRVVHFRMRVVH